MGRNRTTGAKALECVNHVCSIHFATRCGEFFTDEGFKQDGIGGHAGIDDDMRRAHAAVGRQRQFWFRETAHQIGDSVAAVY